MYSRSISNYLLKSLLFILYLSFSDSQVENSSDDSDITNIGCDGTCAKSNEDSQNDESEFPVLQEDNDIKPQIKIYAPSDHDTISGTVFISWEVLFFDTPDGFVQLELDGEDIETPLPLDPATGSFLEPELYLDRLVLPFP